MWPRPRIRSECSHVQPGPEFANESCLLFASRDVDSKAQENDIAFAIADGGPGVGFVRKATKESDWRDVPLFDAAGESFERQLARGRERTGLEPSSGEDVFAGDPSGTKPIGPDSS